jgi:hypothetical protein
MFPVDLSAVGGVAEILCYWLPLKESMQFPRDLFAARAVEIGWLAKPPDESK